MTKQDLIKTIEEIHNQLDRQRSALEDMDFDLREAHIWNEETDIDGEIQQAAAEVESGVESLEKVIKAIKDPATEYKAPETYVRDLGPDDREQILRDKILKGLEPINENSNLVEAVTRQIERDVNDPLNDLQALNLMLQSISKKALIAYLPESGDEESIQ